MINDISEFMASFIEIYIAYKLIEVICCHNMNKQNKIKMIISAVFLSVIVITMNQIQLFSYVTVLTSVLCISISASIIYKVKVQYTFSIISFYILCVFLLDFITLSLISVVTDNKGYGKLITIEGGTARIVFLCIVKGELLFIYVLLKKYLHCQIQTQISKFLLFLSIAGFCGVFFLVEETLKAFDKGVVVSWFVFFSVILLLMFTFYYYMEHKKEKTLLEVMHMRNELMEKNFQAIRDVYESNARMFHDINNHVNTLYQLLEGKDYDEALEYIESLEMPIKKLKASIWTGNQVVDSILNSKKEVAEKNQIRFEINAEYPSGTDILSRDISIILGNLIDNAIEACEAGTSEKEKIIKLVIRKIDNMVIIKIKNSLFHPVKISNKKLETIKTDKKMHGWGMKSIELAAQAYDGTVQFTYTDCMFQVVVTLYYEFRNQNVEEETLRISKSQH